MNRRQVVVLLGAGVAVGLALGLAAPRLAGRYLPASLVGAKETVGGIVRAESREGDRLLLTLETPDGAILVTFRKQVAEVDLLVGVGDSLALALPGYRPFVEDPEVVRVRKGSAGRASAAAAPAPGTETAPAPATVPAAAPAAGSDTLR